MSKPELFDILELLIDLPEKNIPAKTQGTIVECFGKDVYEIEFANAQGETLALCTLSSPQFAIVWQAKTKKWLSAKEKMTPAVKNM